MIKTGEIAHINSLGNVRLYTIICESVGNTSSGRAIWKDVEDLYDCYIFYDGLFHPYEIQPGDSVGELYGTIENEQGERVAYQL